MVELLGLIVLISFHKQTEAEKLSVPNAGERSLWRRWWRRQGEGANRREYRTPLIDGCRRKEWLGRKFRMARERNLKLEVHQTIRQPGNVEISIEFHGPNPSHRIHVKVAVEMLLVVRERSMKKSEDPNQIHFSWVIK